jgi:hypothetical protein
LESTITRVSCHRARHRFDLLIEHTAQATARRNDFAHGGVVQVTIQDARKGYFLFPPVYRPKLNKSFFEIDFDSEDEFAFTGALYRYTAADILTMADQFELLKRAGAEYGLLLTNAYPALGRRTQLAGKKAA